jgi:hypothetical protein
MLVAYQLGTILDIRGIQPVIFTASGILLIITGVIYVLWKKEIKIKS